MWANIIIIISALLQALVKGLDAYNKQQDEDNGRLANQQEVKNEIDAKTKIADEVRTNAIDVDEQLLLPPNQRDA